MSKIYGNKHDKLTNDVTVRKLLRNNHRLNDLPFRDRWVETEYPEFAQGSRPMMTEKPV